MQVNSVNNQNSFGLKFSPRFKNALRELAIDVFSKDGNKDWGYKYTPRVRDIFEKRVQKLKDMMPDAKLDIVDSFQYGNTYIIDSTKKYMSHEVRIPKPIQNIVLKRKGLPDKILGPEYEYTINHVGVQQLIKDLERLGIEEQEPALKAAIERTKKLLP